MSPKVKEAHGSQSCNNVANKKGQTSDMGTPSGGPRGRDPAKIKVIESTRPQAQQCLNRIREKSGEARGPPTSRWLEDNRSTGQELPGSYKEIHTCQTSEIQESKRSKAQTQEKGGQGTSADGHSGELVETGTHRNIKEQEHTTSARQARLSQAEETPEAKRQAGAGP